jgi:multidrug efflux pump subunit AcrA (membrane-fusion protein)
VLLRESQHEEVIVPVRCVVFDGLEAIVFKRDPKTPNVVIRTPVELGARAAGQVEVLAGVMAGDALVADGIQQLKLTGLGKAPVGGHFHADGTWHEDHK